MRSRLLSLVGYLVEVLLALYWVCRGRLTFRQGVRIWFGRAELVMHSPYDDWGEHSPH